MPSIGKDLVRIRTHLGLTIQDIQYATKIPVHTLNKVEDDSIFDQSEEGTIYIRSFVRSYGRALNIDEALMIEALDQYEAGSYQNLLAERYFGTDDAEHADDSIDHTNESTPQADTGQSGEAHSEEEVQERVDEAGGTTTKPESSQEESSDNSVVNEELKQVDQRNATEPARTQRGVAQAHDFHPENRSANVDWAKMGHRTGQDKRPLTLWIIGLIVLVIILGIAGYFIIESDYFSGSDPAQEEITTPSEGSNEVSTNVGSSSGQNTGAGMLGDAPLYLTVYAAYGDAAPVRVWTDLKPRPDPYWLNTGTAMNFEFRDEIRVRGSFDTILLFMNGHHIENPENSFFNEETNDVELTRSYFATNPVWSDSVALRLPEGVAEPDTITNRSLF